MRKFGVEEEFLLVGDDGAPIGVATEAAAAHERTASADTVDAPGGGVDLELQRQQLETGTHPCRTTDELLRELRDGRRRLGEAAAQAGASLAALGTSPIDVGTSFSPSPRYHRMGRVYALTAREQLTCGCHVHGEVDDRAEGVAVIDRIGPWLPVLLAISANSPFWQGADTGYASYRSQVWNRWPSAGPTAPFGSVEAYEGAVAGLVGTGAVLDEGMIYFDARLSARYPTVEVRVADVCLFATDALLVATLARALVEAEVRQAADETPAQHRVELLRA
ncbi:MAG: glutamate--cysteine ligase, partial [Propionicimonas sp.]